MIAAWVGFAVSADSNGGNLPSWPAYAGANDAHMECGDVIKVGSGLLAHGIGLHDEIVERQ